MTPENIKEWEGNVALSDKMTRLGSPDSYISVKASTILAITKERDEARRAFDRVKAWIITWRERGDLKGADGLAAIGDIDDALAYNRRNKTPLSTSL